MVKAETVHITVGASSDEVFDYVANIENLPEWAAPFCRKLEERDGSHYVTSPAGELAFDLVSDRDTGAIDLRFGPAHDRLATFPVRVVPLPEKQSLVVFTGWQLPGVAADEFTGQVEGMRQELGLLKEAVERR